MAQSSAETLSPDLVGKYLTFTLSGEQYGANILKVCEIFGMMKFTRVPRCPEYVKGVINLRGKIIPIVDLRLKFGLEEKEYDRKTCIIVVSIAAHGEEIQMGLIVDTVVEVRDFDEASLAPAPDYGTAVDTKFVVGMGKQADGLVTILIDIDQLFEGAEAAALAPLVQEAE